MEQSKTQQETFRRNPAESSAGSEKVPGGTNSKTVFNNSSAAGIPKDRVFSVFESFVQADQSTTRLYGGTGLGLTIVKSLVELMGGTIKIEEKGTPGSLFRVRLFFRGEEGVSNRLVFTDQSLSPCF
jgi:light-regulated signal transduction histidine kinase (bacteriophytochrome)